MVREHILCRCLMSLSDTKSCSSRPCSASKAARRACVFVCVCVCGNVSINVRMYVQTYAYMYVCMCDRMCVCIYVCVYACMRTCVHAYIRAYLCACVYVSMSTYLCIYAGVALSKARRAIHVGRAKDPVVAEQVGVRVLVAHLAAPPHVVVQVLLCRVAQRSASARPRGGRRCVAARC